ncbi:hypothetical protein M5K25_005280 [Dendrobium thyrsiflorum]|uniref:Uncharacterized protein n=1 Tax=Dendrobium thyrsiflorum TaxID=117978 RepID=A0ABD0VH94_DENTH
MKPTKLLLNHRRTTIRRRTTVGPPTVVGLPPGHQPSPDFYQTTDRHRTSARPPTVGRLSSAHRPSLNFRSTTEHHRTSAQASTDAKTSDRTQAIAGLPPDHQPSPNFHPTIDSPRTSTQPPIVTKSLPVHCSLLVFFPTPRSAAAGVTAPPPTLPTGAATATAPPPEGTEANFSLPEAISSVMSLPLTSDKRNSILSSSASAPTLHKTDHYNKANETRLNEYMIPLTMKTENNVGN